MDLAELTFIPEGKSLEEVRVMREKIQAQVIELINEHGWGK